MTNTHHREIPGEVLEYILSFVPSTDKLTLATLLRVSKLHCQYSAGRLYTNVVLTPRANPLLDTGLPPDLLDGPQEGQGGEESGSTASTTPPPTLKRAFLALMKTVDVYPPRPAVPVPISTDLDQWSNDAATPLGSTRLLLSSLLHPSLPQPLLHCDQLRLRLDTSSYRRLSPYEVPSDDLTPGPLYDRLFDTLRSRRLVLHGAGFHQDSSPVDHLPSSQFDTLEEIIVIITPGAMPGDADMLSMNHGLPFILDCLIRALDSAYLSSRGARVPSVAITFVLQTPRPGLRFPPIIPPPHGSMAMTMDYHPDYAPGYLHALTTSLSQRMVVKRTLGSEERKARVGIVTFVNFGMLEGEQVGMPQAAEEEMQDRFEKGLRVRLRRAGVSKEHQGLKVVGMREWLIELEGKDEGVLDEDILKGWR